MKKVIRFVSILLVVCTLFGVCSINASAATKVKSASSGNYYLIQHVGSGKYLDITDESTSNGARLQIWQRYPEHQNQVFYFQKVGNYWKIIAHNSGKAIEVRNSSKSNNAHVAQWSYDGLKCQQWSIIKNSDGTVSFKNRNSGKYLDVSGNGTANGTKVVQYTSNGTTAQKFKLYRLDNKDILNATWTRNLKNSNISWNKNNWNNYVANDTSFTKNGYYPTPDKTYLLKVEYIDADTVHDLLVQKGLNKSTINKIKELVNGEFKEDVAEKIIDSLDIDIPYFNIIMGILEILATSNSSEEWNKFAKTTKSGKGIIKTTYITFVSVPIYQPVGGGKVGYKVTYHIKPKYSYTYSVWNGNGGVKAPSGYSGSWDYAFK